LLPKPHRPCAPQPTPCPSYLAMRFGWRSPSTVPSDLTRSFIASCCRGEHPSLSLRAGEIPHSLMLSAVILFTSLSKLRTSGLDLLWCQFSLHTSVLEYEPGSIDAMRVTISHVLFEMILPFENLVLVTARANIASVHTVCVLYTVPQKGIPSCIRLATPIFLTSPSFVRRALGVSVETSKILKLEPTLQTYQTLDLVVLSSFAIMECRWRCSMLVLGLQSRSARALTLCHDASLPSVRVDRGRMRKFGRWNAGRQYRCWHGIRSLQLFEFCLHPRPRSKMGVVYRISQRQRLVRVRIV